jgi:hypothetical protein
MSVCRKCIEDKRQHENSTLPCLEFDNLWASGRFNNSREILCRVGPYHWCPRFCNLSDRKLEFRVQRELPEIAAKFRSKWFAEKV